MDNQLSPLCIPYSMYTHVHMCTLYMYTVADKLRMAGRESPGNGLTKHNSESCTTQDSQFSHLMNYIRIYTRHSFIVSKDTCATIIYTCTCIGQPAIHYKSFLPPCEIIFSPTCACKYTCTYVHVCSTWKICV